MKNIAFLAVAALAIAAPSATGLRAQTLLHPVGGFDGGGGASSGTGFNLLGSIGQTAAGSAADADTGIGIEGGIIPPLRSGSGTVLTTAVSVQTSWNMISIPVIPPDPTKTVLLPSAVSSAFVYHPPPTGYVSEDTLQPGVGFWAKFPGVETIGFTGTGITLDTIPVNAGWNLIGAISYPVLADDVTPVGGLTVLSSYFAFTGGFGYSSEDTLEPGRAYWVKVSQAGALILASGSVAIAPAGPPPASVRESSGGWNGGGPGDAVVFRDALGRSRTLSISDPAELPPPPPGGEFDVRFAQVERADADAGAGAQAREYPVLISGAVWPVEVTRSPERPELRISLVTRSSGGERLRELTAGGGATVEGPSLLSLRAGNMAAPALVPSEYRLHQNHPNPFNPSTSVEFDMPAGGMVEISVHNALGQRVAELFRGEIEAGRHSVRFDGSALPSGVYFYRMTAAAFTGMKKMVLLK